MLGGLAFPPSLWSITMAAAVATGCLAALIPAMAAARTPITVAMRHTG
jgi:hypothetical protein